MFQFFVDAGAYSFPTLGAAYTRSNKVTTNTFGDVPSAYVKLVPNSSFSLQIGKLPTLIGAEYNFTFENTNIERGLLWAQEPQFGRGVQGNYTAGPLTLSVSLTDGFYSDKYSYVTGSAAYVVDAADTVTVVGGFNTKKTTVASLATPQLQNNSTIVNAYWSHTQGEWTIVPALQYTSVPSLSALGTSSASTTGGAVYVTYAFPSASPLSGVSLPVRLEYETSKGSTDNLVGYGPSSKAYSVTFTPTYQYKIYFVRAELSYTGVTSLTSGDGFGTSGTAKSQTRALLETGVLF